MFTEARIKLTGIYLVIIMLVSFAFSAFIYRAVTHEFERRFEVIQQRLERFPPLVHNTPFGPGVLFVKEDRDFVRARVLSLLVYANFGILVFSGLAGYYLAGRTLNPIAKNMEVQKEFISNASHELRTPLTSLKTEIEVALRAKKLSSTEARKLLKSNLEEVNKMQKLSNYLLKLGKYEVGLELPMAKIDLRKVALEAIGMMKVKKDLRKSVVIGNKDALIELATILIDNALKYGEGKAVEVRTKSGGILEVTDHGIGISNEDLPYIFDRFYRADKARTKDGYGLGLSIAKSIVDLHGGTIKVESKLRKGSVFTVQLRRSLRL